MIGKKELEGTPMYKALLDLAGAMDRRRMPPAELNVIGGFALMMRGIRPADGITDIDYVGLDLTKDLAELIAQIGLKHKMEPGWINNDAMIAGDALESFEASTGKLHFDPAVRIGKIWINVLDEKDLLRMKVIAVDTAMTEMEATGEFARAKDFGDIRALMAARGMTTDDMKAECGDYILYRPDTEDLLSVIYREGPESGISWIRQKAEVIRSRKTITEAGRQ